MRLRCKGQSREVLCSPLQIGLIGAARLVAQTWGGADLTSITSWFDRRASGTVDTTNAVGALFGGFGSPLGPPYPTSYADAVPTQLGAHEGQFTQEVRIASRDGAAPLRWLGGVFYSHVRQTTGTVSYPILAPQVPYITYATQATYAELAGFANATLRFSSRWRAFAGGRVTRARTEVVAHAQGLIYPTPGLARADLLETPLIPRFGLMYEDGPGHIVYVSAAKGFRTGGTIKCGRAYAIPRRLMPMGAIRSGATSSERRTHCSIAACV